MAITADAGESRKFLRPGPSKAFSYAIPIDLRFYQVDNMPGSVCQLASEILYQTTIYADMRTCTFIAEHPAEYTFYSMEEKTVLAGGVR